MALGSQLIRLRVTTRWSNADLNEPVAQHSHGDGLAEFGHRHAVMRFMRRGLRLGKDAHQELRKRSASRLKLLRTCVR